MTNILYQEHQRIATISLNRPESLNAFTPEMLQEFDAALTTAGESSSARVIVLQGSGRAFSAGVDLNVLKGIEPEAGRIGDVFDKIANRITQSIRQHRLPVIAKVHGACFTGALEIALNCDFIFAAADTKFGDTHVKWGLRPTWGMAQNLARAVGVRRARQLSYSAQIFSGTKAAQWGLVNSVSHTIEALNQQTDTCAREISEGSPGAVTAYKKLYQVHEKLHPLEAALIEENTLQFLEINDTKDRLARF